MNVNRAAGCLVTQAPAKVNLFFEVLAKRKDGFHEIETLMCPIRLFDTLAFEPDPAGQISLSCEWATGLQNSSTAGDPAAESFGDLPQGEANIVMRAVQLLQRAADVTAGAKLRLVKRIPSQAGLGGGSSDAAAALLLANEGWNLHWPRERLIALAAQLGSDVPFFLLDGPAICRGRGERIEPVRLRSLQIVVVRPPVGLSTAAVYKTCRVPAQPKQLEPLVEALQRDDDRPVAKLMHNALQPAAEALTPWIQRLQREFAAVDCDAHQMSGSGSSYFGLFRHSLHARRAAQKLRARNIGRVFAVTS